MSKLITHYQNLYHQYGPGPEAVQYSNFESQNARFEILTQIDNELNSILDIGCGLADLWAFIRSKGDKSLYLGLDIVPEFIKFANERFDDDSKAQLVSSLDPLPLGYDYAILSGVFNNKIDNNWEFMTDTLKSMFKACNKGISFNAMSLYVDYFDPDLFYVDPAKVLDFCKKDLGGYPVLRHDYILSKDGFPFEFVIYVYKSPNFFGDL